MKRVSENKINQGLLAMIEKSPNAFFAVRELRERLQKEGFTELSEAENWKIESGGSYFVTRNDSALIAFRMPQKAADGFRMIASHVDSPVFKVKPNAEISVEDHYIKLNVEKYGGMILSTWLDRPLSIAGRVVCKSGKTIATKLVNLDQDLLVIPNLAIHMDRKTNDGYVLQVQKDMLPLFSGEKEKGGLFRLIGESAGVSEKEILDADLYLYNRQKGTIFGANREFLAAPRLDDLQCVYASLEGLLAAVPGKKIALCAMLDNEEVGSGTKQGAGGSFVSDVLHRITAEITGAPEDYYRFMAGSYLVSADNAHAVHPNRADKADPTNRPYLNGGVVIKYNADQKYTSDAVSAGLFRLICEERNVPVQTYTNHSDIPGGSTLGKILSASVSVPMVDVGLPQLAMHSAFETAGAKDTAYFVRAAAGVFESDEVLP